MLSIEMKKLHPDAILPKKMHSNDSGFDLYSLESTTISPHERFLINTGIAIAIPNGYEGQIRSRSGNALKHGYFVLNSPGTIDSNYRGPLKVLIYNASEHDIHIKYGDRIAQLVIQRLPEVEFLEVNELSETDRNTQGFGSTDYW